MSDLGDAYRRRAGAFGALIDGTAPARWSSPSPCEGWSARDVVAHVVDYSAVVLRDKAGVSEAPASFAATRSVIERLLDDPATPRKVAGHLHWSLSFDLPQHGWDLAVATGQDPAMDPDEVELLWGALNGDPANWDWQAGQRVVCRAGGGRGGRSVAGPGARPPRPRSEMGGAGLILPSQIGDGGDTRRHLLGRDVAVVERQVVRMIRRAHVRLGSELE